jgi:hypothetical protein
MAHPCDPRCRAGAPRVVTLATSPNAAIRMGARPAEHRRARLSEPLDTHDGPS